MGVRIRSGRRGGAPLLAFGRPRVPAESVLRGTQPPVDRDQEFSFADAAAGAISIARALLLASGLFAGGERESCRVSSVGTLRGAAAVSGPARVCFRGLESSASHQGAAADSAISP